MTRFRKKFRRSYQWEVVYCYICGDPITSHKDYTLDHEPPKSRQKELGKSELYPCCKACNNKKGALTLDEFHQWLMLEQKRNGR